MNQTPICKNVFALVYYIYINYSNCNSLVGAIRSKYGDIFIPLTGIIFLSCKIRGIGEKSTRFGFKRQCAQIHFLKQIANNLVEWTLILGSWDGGKKGFGSLYGPIYPLPGSGFVRPLFPCPNLSEWPMPCIVKCQK